MKTTSIKGILAGFFVLLILASIPVFAHAPKTITLEFDLNASSLKVEIQHPVKNPANHYIKRIRIYLNGEMIQEKSYSSQETGEGQSETFVLKGVKAGDEILVKATCNKFGGKRSKIKVT
jgi:desulfoferrodoxin (superoxide reductase-like protein)